MEWNNGKKFSIIRVQIVEEMPGEYLKLSKVLEIFGSWCDFGF